jgi:hypothetical protein
MTMLSNKGSSISRPKLGIGTKHIGAGEIDFHEFDVDDLYKFIGYSGVDGLAHHQPVFSLALVYPYTHGCYQH